MQQKISIRGIAYWGTTIFAAVAMGYMLVTLINLSSEEETAYLGTVNYREQIRYVVVTTSEGNFKIAFLRAQAPVATKQFLRLADAGFYDETKFYHFPGGVYVESGLASDSPEEEKSVNRAFVENPEKVQMVRGYVAMPRRSGEKMDPSLLVFFTEDEEPLPSGVYAAFGRIVEGMEVVDKINEVSPTINSGKRPPVSLLSVIQD
ncbi:MAG: hypothetical protein A2762_03285 [Candidatus Lloydbacteria bacterium RIFCSPHIGHO2_01_FULL_54_11]|nr:MAG: hypothetical protein A2762_03285 [Candidatus Lloydbacteria bacterium RIFCSPHIGHO2_01_FULL_54_11]OGZ15436.1 MAG: hypothetical protein A3H76_01395 [Candidatus Lloydbacteria bacterium RIFCSPLOWO2_02_FULL_54_12]